MGCTDVLDVCCISYGFIRQPHDEMQVGDVECLDDNLIRLNVEDAALVDVCWILYT